MCGCQLDDSDDVGEEEKALYDKEEENNEEDEEKDVNEVDKAKDEEEEEQEDSKVGEETNENKGHMSSDIDDTDEESDASVSTNVHSKAKKQSSDNTLKYAKKSAHNEGNVKDVMSKNLFSGDLKLKVAENDNWLQLQRAPIVKVLYKQANIGFAAERFFFGGGERGRFDQKKGVTLLPQAIVRISEKKILHKIVKTICILISTICTVS